MIGQGARAIEEKCSVIMRKFSFNRKIKRMNILTNPIAVVINDREKISLNFSSTMKIHSIMYPSLLVDGNENFLPDNLNRKCFYL